MNINKLKRIVDQFTRANVLVIGDIILDRFLVGNVSRISPEAPVPVVDLISETFKLGGAANVINNLKMLGGQVTAVGVIGDDANGKKLIDLFKQNGINSGDLITINDKPTTVKTRVLAEQQQVLRIDKESKEDIDSEYTQQILDIVNKKIEDMDAVLISDYDKGVITKKLLEELIPLAKKYNKPIIADPKIEHLLDYKGVTVITPNVKEASTATAIRLINETNIQNMGKRLLTQLDCGAVLITRGSDGMSLFEEDGNLIHIPTNAEEVYDVTGAGDTVTSVVALGLAVGAEAIDAAIIANAAAGITVRKLGTATISREELKYQLEKLREK